MYTLTQLIHFKGKFVVEIRERFQKYYFFVIRNM